MTNSLLIENWFPFEAVGAESQREHSFGTPFPAPNRLHVWWARRPLTTSRAAILAGVLPEWSSDFPLLLKAKFPDNQAYQLWIHKLLGIKGDPIAGKKLADWAKKTGNWVKNPYNTPRAFTVNPEPEDLKTLGDLLELRWGTRDVSVMDVTAGGGSIPLEALRYGFTTYANELNPVASIILIATLDYPARFGKSLADDIRKWGDIWAKRSRSRLKSYFAPLPPNVEGAAYLWTRTIACPVTGKDIPLSPNWWLNKEKGGIAAQMVVHNDWEKPRFVIGVPGETVTLEGSGKHVTIGDPNKGTIARGVAISPWTNEAVDGEYIKAEAQAGRMGQMLYAVALKRRGGFDFRAPTDADLAAIAHAEADLAQKTPIWIASGLMPEEEIPIGNKTDEPRRYGMYKWESMFSPRQLFSMMVFLEELHNLRPEIEQAMDANLAKAVQTYLGVMLDKCTVYNNRACRFDPGRGIRSVFDRHDFAFVWSHAEFDASANLIDWAVDQVEDAFINLVDLSNPTHYPLWQEDKLGNPIDRLNISQGSATDLSHVQDRSIHNITFDPPYYDNVMYAELSDFFYVWLKRSVGHLFPQFFRDELSNKDDEAVANIARFADMGRNKKKLAEGDYERKMEAIFRECHRVLRDDGCLTIMFTHKKVEAWDTLASALINAGFVVKSSWPVHTESENSLHQAKKNAASSTILLTCRKRDGEGEAVWWDDIKGEVKRVARQKAEDFAAQGISGVDLYISTFGPALAVISEQWPVLSSEVDDKGQPVPLRPEVALDLAREEVVALRKQGLLLGRDIDFDPITDWYLMAWDAFKASEFPYDEARKLAIALGVDLDGDIRSRKNLITKKSNSVVIQEPVQRRKRGMVDPDVSSFDTYVDAVHTALMLLQEDGAKACEAFLKQSGLLSDSVFKQCVQAMLYAIPRTKVKGKWARPEAEYLEGLRLNFFTDLTVPQEEQPPQIPTTKNMFDAIEGEEDWDEEGEDEEA